MPFIPCMIRCSHGEYTKTTKIYQYGTQFCGFHRTRDYISYIMCNDKTVSQINHRSPQAHHNTAYEKNRSSLAYVPTQP